MSFNPLQSYKPITLSLEDDHWKMPQTYESHQLKNLIQGFSFIRNKTCDSFQAPSGCKLLDSKIYQLITEKYSEIERCEVDFISFCSRLLINDSKVLSIHGKGFLDLFRVRTLAQATVFGVIKLEDSLVDQLEADQILMKSSIVTHLKSQTVVAKNSQFKSLIAKRIILSEARVIQSVFAVNLKALECPLINQITCRGNVYLRDSHVRHIEAFSIFLTRSHVQGDVKADIVDMEASCLFGTLYVRSHRLEIVSSVVQKVAMGSFQFSFKVNDQEPSQIQKQLALLLLQKKAHVFYQQGQYTWVFGDHLNKNEQAIFLDWNDIKIHGNKFEREGACLKVDNLPYLIPPELNSQALIEVCDYANSMRASNTESMPSLILKDSFVDEIIFQSPGIVILKNSHVNHITNGSFKLA